jgi:integrase
VKSRYIEETEISKLRLVTEEEAFLPLRLSLETGLRVGDVVALRTSSVKADGIHYTAQKTRKRGVAPISADLRKRLNKRGKWLFPSPYKCGAHITRQAVWYRIKVAGKRAGVDLNGLSPHTMRKVFAVELYRKQGFKAVQTALQHNNSATTEIYSFADWNTGENADLPLKRRDLQLVVKMVLEALGDSYKLPAESKKKKK